MMIRTNKMMMMMTMMTFCRCLHHQPEEDMGEAAVCCKSNCCHWEPGRRLCHLCKAVRTASSPQVCFLHWSDANRWSFHSGNFH